MDNEKLNEMAEAHINSIYEIKSGKVTKLMMHVRKESYLAGFQSAISLPEVKAMKEALESIAQIDVSENPPDLIWLNKWRNDTKLKAQKALADMGEVINGN